MEYIAFRRYHKKAICEALLDIPIGCKFNTIGPFIVTADNKPICVTTSFSSHQHFARNDDGKGLRRGAITWAIAFKDRTNEDNNGVRWSFKEAELIYDKYQKFLRPEHKDVMLFNDDFFHADINELEEMAKELNVIVEDKIKEDSQCMLL